MASRSLLTLLFLSTSALASPSKIAGSDTEVAVRYGIVFAIVGLAAFIGFCALVDRIPGAKKEPQTTFLEIPSTESDLDLFVTPLTHSASKSHPSATRPR